LFTGSSTAPADLGGKLIALGFTAAFFALSGSTYDVDSEVAPLTSGTFPVNASNLNIGVLTGTGLVQGASIIIFGKLVPDTIIALPSAVATPDLSTLGTVTNLGGNLRQLTIPIQLPNTISFSGQTVTGTISGQLVATATVITNVIPTI